MKMVHLVQMLSPHSLRLFKNKFRSSGVCCQGLALPRAQSQPWERCWERSAGLHKANKALPPPFVLITSDDIYKILSAFLLLAALFA